MRCRRGATKRQFLAQICPNRDRRRRRLGLARALGRRRRKVRIYDTVRDAESVPMQLHKNGWPTRFIPVSYLDEAGVEQPSWPEHPTITPEWLDRERSMYARMGELDIWEREYMCNPATQADRTFQTSLFGSSRSSGRSRPSMR